MASHACPLPDPPYPHPHPHPPYPAIIIVPTTARAQDAGKVHGSLARAGKVKGQTPKVEKQEKKKKAVGKHILFALHHNQRRAKKRLQYTRRFVNAVAGFGGKRRMNPNDGGNK
ncbi:hypothetical protein HDU84_001222 [Entophlyctis sp. JEL0112]|nr:hypothetical protein HDU84_001222 [Entophlyctis sp. JEL0112]